MKWEVKLFVGGKVFTEEVYATSHKDARDTAIARNPKCLSDRSQPDYRRKVKRKNQLARWHKTP